MSRHVDPFNASYKGKAVMPQPNPLAADDPMKPPLCVVCDIREGSKHDHIGQWVCMWCSKGDAGTKVHGEEFPLIGRNAPCPCQSGKKFKKCCLLRAPQGVIVRGNRLSGTKATYVRQDKRLRDKKAKVNFGSGGVPAPDPRDTITIIPENMKPTEEK